MTSGSRGPWPARGASLLPADLSQRSDDWAIGLEQPDRPERIDIDPAQRLALEPDRLPAVLAHEPDVA